MRAGHPRLKDSAKKADELRPDAPPQPQSGPELVTTVVKAAGKLGFLIGITVGQQIVPSAPSALPKP